MLFDSADGILDLRSFEEFKVAHLPESTWMAWQDVPDHLNELPAAPAKLFLVGSHQAIEEVSLYLHEKNYQVSGSLLINHAEDLARWQQQLPGLFISGKESKTLWSPSALVKEFIESVVTDSKSHAGTAIDLGCGGGRDAVFLAKQGWKVTAIDQESRVIKRAKQLASRAGASVKWKCCDLKKAGCLPETEFDLVLVMRFLNRNLYSEIDARVKPGGWLVFQTFVEGVEVFGSPKNPNYILRKGELAQVFADFKVIIDRIDILPDGRPVACFVGQKRGGNRPD
ncbi:methyltransferase domain-containing protein [Thiomicrorhabdus chilensis]|uniref:methyltransferase domain-containing protein n=1 Tax=Thiomicrorhabdus chilensis TaxID=63656 RepID=UPI000417C8D2|nr:methyltransferase domain-containing protein [Thiomicrorhabdus chilensis]